MNHCLISYLKDTRSPDYFFFFMRAFRTNIDHHTSAIDRNDKKKSANSISALEINNTEPIN